MSLVTKIYTVPWKWMEVISYKQVSYPNIRLTCVSRITNKLAVRCAGLIYELHVIYCALHKTLSFHLLKTCCKERN